MTPGTLLDRRGTRDVVEPPALASVPGEGGGERLFTDPAENAPLPRGRGGSANLSLFPGPGGADREPEHEPPEQRDPREEDQPPEVRVCDHQVLGRLRRRVCEDPDEHDEDHPEDVRNVAREEPQAEEPEDTGPDLVELRDDERDERAREDPETVDPGAGRCDHDGDLCAGLRVEREGGCRPEKIPKPVRERVHVGGDPEQVEHRRGLRGKSDPGIRIDAPVEVLVVEPKEQERDHEDQDQGRHEHQDEVPFPTESRRHEGVREHRAREQEDDRVLRAERNPPEHEGVVRQVEGDHDDREGGEPPHEPPSKRDGVKEPGGEGRPALRGGEPGSPPEDEGEDREAPDEERDAQELVVRQVGRVQDEVDAREDEDEGGENGHGPVAAEEGLDPREVDLHGPSPRGAGI